MTLETLLDRAAVSQYQRHTWFSSARLVLNSLMVADIDQHNAIERCFLSELRRVHPPLALTFSPERDAPAERAAPAPRQSAFKKPYVARHAPPVQRDML